MGQSGRGWRAKGGSEHALVVLTRNGERPAVQVADVNREGVRFSIELTGVFEGVVKPADLEVISWTVMDSPQYGSPENDKQTHVVRDIALSADRKRLVVELESVPDFKKNTLMRFSSKRLPATAGRWFEVFYTVTVE